MISRLKRGGRCFLGIVVVLMFAFFVYSFRVGTTTIDTPVTRANLTGSVTAQITITNILGGTNVTNVTFFFDNSSGFQQVIGTNTSQNLTVYTINWATTAAGTGEGVNFTFIANVTYYNMTGPDVNVSTTSTVNITVDNTRPRIIPNAPVNNTNSSSAVTTFNFTVTDTVDTVFDCNLTLDPANSTFGTVINTSTTVLNGTATTFINTIQEGRHTWNVQCLDTVSLSNQTNNLTFSVATSLPALTLNYPPNASVLNSTAFAFNFTPISTVFTLFTDCNLTIDSTNATGGGIINSSSNVANGSVTSYQTIPADGDRTWNVQCRDPANNVRFSTNNSFTFDSVKPSINLFFLDVNTEEEKTSFGPGAEVKVECKRNDITSGFNRTEIFVRNPSDGSSISKKVDTSSATGTAQFTIDHTIPSTETKQLGSYFIECMVDDRAGVRFRTNKTFEITKQAPKGSSAFAIPGFSAPVGKVKISSGVTSDGGRLSTEGISRLMQTGATLKLDIKGIDHMITVDDLTDETATLKITSEPITLTLNKGETVDADLDRDGTNDLVITFHKRFPPGGKFADLTFMLTNTPAVETINKKGGASIQEELLKEMAKIGSEGFVVALLVVVVIIAVGYFILVKKK